MGAKWKGLGLVVVIAVAFALGLGGFASATGSGYNQSYTQTAGHASVAAVDLISASSSYTSGPNLTISFTVSGTIDFTGADQGYIVWFGGSSYTNATTWAIFANTTAAWVSSSPTGEGLLVPVVSGGTLSFSIATANLPAPSAFSFNVLAYHGYSETTGEYSWLGTNYNGGGTCTGSSCTTTTSTPASFNWWIVIIPVIVIVVIVVLVVVLMMRKKPPTQPAMMGQPGQPMGQPGQPGQPDWSNAPQPPAGQPTWPTPPASPPPGAQ